MAHRITCTVEMDAASVSRALSQLVEAIASARRSQQADAAPPPPTRKVAPPQHAAPPSSASSGFRRAPVEPVLLSSPASWSRLWSSPPSEHTSCPVTALCWAAAIDGLPGGDGHAGWLLSSARGTLNLWECSPGAPYDCTLMHTGLTPCGFTCLDVDTATGLLMAGSATARSGPNAAAVCLHALRPDAEAGFLGLAGALRPAAPLGGAPRPAGSSLHVASLTPCGGVLSACAAIAFGAEVSVTALPRGSGPAAAASAAHKTTWRAVGTSPTAHVTALAPWPTAPLLLTGSSDGFLSAWDLRSKPAGASPQPAASSRCGAGRVVLAHPCGAAMALAVCASGEATLWDLRKMGSGAMAPAAHAAACPSHAASSAAASATGDGLAVAGAGGASLHAAPVSPVVGGGVGGWAKLPERGQKAGALCWGGRHGANLYAGGDDGSVTIYRQW